MKTQMPILVTLLIMLSISFCKTEKKEELISPELLLLSTLNATKTAEVPTVWDLTAANITTNKPLTSRASTSTSLVNNYAVPLSNEISITSFLGAPTIKPTSGITVVYSISPAPPTGLVFDSTIAKLSGTISSAQNPKNVTYTLAATFTPQEGYKLPSASTNTLTKQFVLYMDSAAGITNVTCSFVGAGGGCAGAAGYSCTASASCSNVYNCTNLTACFF